LAVAVAVALHACRSGWQPPKDTGLWDISARVKSQIEAQMTPLQKEYWAAQGGYFEQVRGMQSAIIIIIIIIIMLSILVITTTPSAPRPTRHAFSNGFLYW
jgi:hypothetical protein